MRCRCMALILIRFGHGYAASTAIRSGFSGAVFHAKGSCGDGGGLRRNAVLGQFEFGRGLPLVPSDSYRVY